MNCFDRIVFVDDEKKATSIGVPVIGKTNDLPELNCHYANDFFFNPEEWAKRMNEMKKPIDMRTPVPIDEKVYSFDDVM